MLEVLLSIFVLSVGILAALTLITTSLRTSINARNQIIASQLAQEGAELVINARDSNKVKSLDQFDSICSSPGNCTGIADYSSGLNFSSSVYGLNYIGGFYTHTAGGTATAFKRKVSVSISAPPRTAVVTSFVWWGGETSTPATCNTANKCVSVQTALTENNN